MGTAGDRDLTTGHGRRPAAQSGEKLARSPADPHRVTRLLLRWGGGDESALNELIPRVHFELRRIARRCMAGERRGHSLQATALVNEAYLRLVDVQHVNWQNRTHFLAMSARPMRRILVDVADEPGQDPAAIDDALHSLARLDGRKARVVEGTASVLDMSVQTVMRDWKFAKAWLSKELREVGGRDAAEGKAVVP